MGELMIKPWTCTAGHVLGQIVREADGGRKLILYRYAAVEGVDIDVLTVIDGYAVDVRCDICGAVKTWYPDRQHVRRARRKMRW